MTRLSRFAATRARRQRRWFLPPLPPDPLDPLIQELRAASQRSNELLGPALAMLGQRRRIRQWIRLAVFVGLGVAGYVVLLLHPEWALSH